LPRSSTALALPYFTLDFAQKLVGRNDTIIRARLNDAGLATYERLRLALWPTPWEIRVEDGLVQLWKKDEADAPAHGVLAQPLGDLTDVWAAEASVIEWGRTFDIPAPTIDAGLAAITEYAKELE
jgi:hypothetical protein